MSKLQTNKQQRDSNIELLRILAIFGVIILHLNNRIYHGGFEIVNEGSSLYYFLLAVESLFIFPVDLFFIISGYFMANKKTVSIRKPVELIIQVILIKIALTSASTILKFITNRPEKFSIKPFLSACIPNNYFVILYCAIFLVCPVVNKAFEGISSKTMTNLTVLFILIFSLEPILADVIKYDFGADFTGLSTIGAEGSMDGYTFTNFLLCYIIGCFLRKNNFEISFKLNVFIWLSTVILIFIWSCAAYSPEYSTQWEYCNPLVIIEAASLFLMFKKLNVGKNKIINTLSKGVFTVFLVHSYFLNHAIKFVFSNQNIALVFAKMLLSCIVIYLICWIVYVIYDFIMRFVYDFIESKIGFYNIVV